ncbi:MAG: AlpA family phage regulatory protein [Deltaproteobacteria bacterium]|jgi:prophage regulatory protein|nr:AlpA family phage regulatory protein [Deltaproteobacteria bacterium]
MYFDDSFRDDGFRLIREKELLIILSIGKSTLWDWVGKGIFPKPIKLGPRVVAWILSEVMDHLKNLR